MITNVLEYLEQSAQEYPSKVAFADEKESYSYSQLMQYGQAIGTVLADKDIIKKPVVIYLEKSVRVIASFMGILYGGSFYCPIDVSMPIERVKLILNVLDMPYVITDAEQYDVISEIIGKEHILIYEDICASSINCDLLQKIRRKTIDMDPMYILFTSGSTGVPKGVVISHQSVIEYTEWVTETFKITESDSFGNQAPFYFDNSILDIYCGLKNSATVYIIPKEHFKYPKRLLNYLNEKKITTIFFVPSALCIVAELHSLEKVSLETVNKILFCGEVMPNKYLNIWRKYVPNALYANLYGPTEITDVCTYFIVDREFEDDEPLPIGTTCKNTDCVILDEENKEPILGQVGELCIRGRSLALGYYKNPEKSSEVFIQNPLNREYRDLIYRTGDLVRINDKGEILYVGRKDFQIKHLGHRIELGEIEVAAGGIAGVETCACIYDDAKQKIVFCYTGEELDKNIIKEVFKEKLPSYMVPGIYVYLNELPYNANGKIDRKLLKKQVVLS